MTQCNLGVGCDEYGVCYAAAHGQPDRCGANNQGDDMTMQQLILNDGDIQQRLFNSGSTLTNLCHELAYEAGWWKTANGQDVRDQSPEFLKLWVGTKLALIHSEVSEGLEGHRKDLMDDKLPHRKMLEVELADAAIRIFDLAGGLGFDLGGAILEKLQFNATRQDHKIETRQGEGGKAY